MQLLHGSLKTSKVNSSVASIREMLDPFVSLLLDCLSSMHVKVCPMCLTGSGFTLGWSPNCLYIMFQHVLFVTLPCWCVCRWSRSLCRPSFGSWNFLFLQWSKMLTNSPSSCSFCWRTTQKRELATEKTSTSSRTASRCTDLLTYTYSFLIKLILLSSFCFISISLSLVFLVCLFLISCLFLSFRP